MFTFHIPLVTFCRRLPAKLVAFSTDEVHGWIQMYATALKAQFIDTWIHKYILVAWHLYARISREALYTREGYMARSWLARDRAIR
jgi:hypothetical protein